MRTFVRLFPVAGVLLWLAALAAAQEQQPFGFRLTEWNQTLNQVEAEAERPDLSPARVDRLRDRLLKLRREAQAAKSQAQEALQPLRDRLTALGPAPAEGEAPESADISTLRSSLNDQIADYEGRIKQLDLITAKSQELDARLSAYVREQAIEEVLKVFPLPLAPSTIARAIPEFFVHLGALAQAPHEWWINLSSQQREDIVLYRVALVLALAIAIGWALRRVLLRAFGRNPGIVEPSYARRMLAAVAECLAGGLIPALILGGILIRTIDHDSLATGLFRDVIIAFCLSAMIFVLTWAFTRAALAPDLPSWRLETIRPENAKRLARAITLLAAVFALDVFLMQASESLAVSEQLESLYEFVASFIEAALVINLTRASFWTHDETVEAALQPEDDEDKPSGRAGRFWTIVRIALRIFAVVAVAAALIGYAGLSAYLMDSLLVTGVIGGFLFLLRGLLRELIGASLRSDFVQSRLGVRHNARRLIKFWLRTLLDVAIPLIGLLLVLPVWGVPARDMLIWTSEVLQGFTIGNVTISITDVLVGIAIFAGILIVTRMLQRVLSERVLPQTTLDTGVQNSLSAGLGYLGMILAGALAVTAIGLDLSNLALIAGALSVGIGFGLQNVVNNFVSGLILLIERPIKVGDWIIASGHEGFVKRISVRATELETFQRASVIIPNSELISTSVINWTHKNKLGRLEVPVGVAYGSDVEKVMTIMREHLQVDSRIAKWPEPYVLFQGFGDSSLNFEARGYLVDVGDILSVGSDYRVAIAKAFAENDIEIPFPQRDLHLKDIDRLVDAIAERRQTEAARGTARRQFEEAPRKEPSLGQRSAQPNPGAGDEPDS